jgi:hypothetical protein
MLSSSHNKTAQFLLGDSVRDVSLKVLHSVHMLMKEERNENFKSVHGLKLLWTTLYQDSNFSRKVLKGGGLSKMSPLVHTERKEQNVGGAKCLGSGMKPIDPRERCDHGELCGISLITSLMEGKD